MENEKILVLEEIYFDFLEEKKNVEQELNKNLARISQIDGYLKSIYEKEDEDFKVFSPRDVRVLYKDEIEKNIEEKTELENENQYHYKKLDKLTFDVDRLKSLLDELEEEKGKEKTKDEGNEIYDTSLNYDIQEKERQRIARELHDSSLQNLTHLIHKIELSSMFIEQDSIRAKLELAAINKNLKGIIEEIRNTIFDLHPMCLDDLGLKDTLERLFLHLEQNTNMTIKYEIEDDFAYLNKATSMNIFRIIQECCSNAVKHSEATSLKIIMKKNANDIDIQVIDNGKGFDVPDKKENHYGLSIMKERLSLLEGNMDIQSILNEGTTIHIILPSKVES